MKIKLIKVTWEDSRNPAAGWRFLKGLETPGICLCVTVGYLVKKTKKKLVLAQSLTRDNQVNGLTTIPRRCVIESVDLV